MRLRPKLSRLLAQPCHHALILLQATSLKARSLTISDTPPSETHLSHYLKLPSDASRNLTFSKQGNVDDCLREPLTANLWQKLDMNNYLKNYPNGARLSLTDFADEVGVTNFQCGIGNTCSPPQSCSTLDPRDWYALTAAHRFNTLINQIYQATAYAIGVVSDVSSSMVKDLIPEYSMTWVCVAVYGGLAAAAITGTPAFVFGPGAPMVLWIMLMSTMYITTAAAWVEANLIVPDPEKFTHWTEIVGKLGTLGNHLQEALSNFTSTLIESPISSDKGLFGIARDGNLFQEHKRAQKPSDSSPALEDSTPIIDKSQIDVQRDLEQVLKMSSLAHILRMQNAFIIRGGEPCNGDGPDGQESSPNHLTYCNESGILMKIVLVGTKRHPERPLYKPELIYSKYGLSTQLLTETAWRCQSKFGVQKPSYHFLKNGQASFSKAAFNLSATSYMERDFDCAFDLPVCDLTNPVLRGKLKKRDLLEVCREAGGLPI